MYKIFAVLCIVGCTLAKEGAITPSSASTRRLKARQVESLYGLEHYIEPVQHVVDYVHEPQVVGSAVHYVEPSVVSLDSVHAAAPLVHPVGPSHQVYSYVPSVGYGHPYNYRYHSGSATPFTTYAPVSTQHVTRVQSPQRAFFSGFTQGGQQSGLSLATQQTGFSQETQQGGFTQGTQQSAVSQENRQTDFAQGTQQSSFDQGNQQASSQSVQNDNAEAYVGQSAQQTESQQSEISQNMQGAQQTPSQQNERFQFGVLHSGFGQQQQFGIVQTPSSQAADSQTSFGQRQEVSNDQSGSGQSVFGGSQQSDSAATQQSSGSFSPSTAVSTVAVARQQATTSQSVSQQTGGNVSPASTTSQTFGYPATQGAQAVRLIQPYNLSPSYAIHGLGFRTIQSGPSSAFVSGNQQGQILAGQRSESGSQQSAPAASAIQFSAQTQSSGSQESTQAGAFGIGSNNPSEIQYSYSSQQSASQPATVRSGVQASSSTAVQGSSTQVDGQSQGSLSSFRSSYVASGDASQGSQNTSPTQQPPAILRMSNDLSFDGSFNYGFESENGISSSAVGSLRTVDSQHPAQIISGSYSYTAPDGTPISTNYYADETGFHAQGAHLPTPHPLPEYVARALEILPQQGNTDQAQPTVESN